MSLFTSYSMLVKQVPGCFPCYNIYSNNSSSEAFKSGILCQSKLGVCHATMQKIKGLEQQKFSMEKKGF